MHSGQLVMKSNEYQKNGYFVIKNFLQMAEVKALREVLLDFHESWKIKNADFYAEKAVNSAYITGTEHLDEASRKQLFNFIGSDKLMNVVVSVIEHRPAFMNTQLFFNPVNKAQKNYWHRDPQYHLSVAEQKEALKGPNVVHFRIPLLDEPGIELVPGSHKKWDSQEEQDVRLENNQRKNHENLSTGVIQKLNAGDLLVFSANMIHRGLYGLDRLALDILFCDSVPALLEFAEADCLPSRQILDGLENSEAFSNTLAMKNSSATKQSTQG